MEDRMEKEIAILKDNGLGVIPTDTVYGLVASAFSPLAIEKMYRIKKRNRQKPFIFLISSLEDLRLFNIRLKRKEEKIISRLWPGEISILFSCSKKKFFYLHRGTKKLAIRWPKDKKLQNFLKKTGPLASSSANPEGNPPAKNGKEARNYFGKQVDFYQKGKNLTTTPSTLIDLENGQVKIIRPGKFSQKDLDNILN